jgi:hypothetical protein
MDWMIYGANGYTGALIAREAKKRGAAPILAGRNAAQGLKSVGSGAKISLNACGGPQHLQRPAPTHLSKSAPSFQSIGDADLARSRR